MAQLYQDQNSSAVDYQNYQQAAGNYDTTGGFDESTGQYTDYSNQEYYDSGIYVPDVNYWNAVDNTPAYPPGSDNLDAEQPQMATNFIFDKDRGGYYNPYDPNEFYPSTYMEEIARKSGPVEETIVQQLTKRRSLKKLETALSLYEQKNQRLSSVSERQSTLPKIRIIKLKPRYQIQYPGGLPKDQQQKEWCK